MKSLFIERHSAYDGTQLRSLYAYLDHGVLGDSIVAWEGPCEISFEHMVDGEDLLAQSPIRGSHMLHFIVECFSTQLFTAVALQRLMASLCADLLREQLPDKVVARTVRREGDDVFVSERKLSISIATVSPSSALIHFAVNVSNEGTPVETAALGEFGLKPRDFATELMKRFTEEYNSIKDATCKVRWVK